MSTPTPCPEWADALAARVPEDLSSSQREALARHLASCQRCAQASTDYDALTERVRAATREDRFLGLTHQLARLRTDMMTLRKSDLLASSPLQDGSSSQPFSSSIPGARMSSRAGQANKGRGFEGMLRITDEIQLHYQMMGSGPHPLLIPAVRWPLTACEELLHQHTLVFYDRHQRRRSKESLHSVPSPEWELEALCQHLDLAQVSLVGWSSFGGIATHYALEHAERIARLLLIRPVPELPVKDEPSAQGQGIEDSARFRSWWETDKDRSPTASRGISLPGASSCHIPTLIIHGGDDPLPVSSSQTWAATLPNARLLTMPGAGSSPWDDTPHPFFAAVTQFLTGAWPQGAVSIEAKSA
jgi:pimeloyl-ACP methyl ester carboxylesterase